LKGCNKNRLLGALHSSLYQRFLNMKIKDFQFKKSFDFFELQKAFGLFEVIITP